MRGQSFRASPTLLGPKKITNINNTLQQEQRLGTASIREERATSSPKRAGMPLGATGGAGVHRKPPTAAHPLRGQEPQPDACRLSRRPSTATPIPHTRDGTPLRTRRDPTPIPIRLDAAGAGN